MQKKLLLVGGIVFALSLFIAGGLLWRLDNQAFLSSLFSFKQGIDTDREVSLLITEEPGPLKDECLAVPQDFELKAGASYYKMLPHANTLSTLKYNGRLGRITTKTQQIEGTTCHYYKIALVKGEQTFYLYLPYKLKAILGEGSGYLADVDGRFLLEQQDKLIEITMVLKQGSNSNELKYYQWKLRFL